MNEHPSRQRALAVVAEDELLLRLEIVDFLTDEGFEVHDARNATLAMEHLERLNGADLLFADIHMMGSRSGLVLAHDVAKRWPKTRIILCSAFERPRADEMPAGSYFFDKPYLDAAVRKVLR